MARTTGPLFSQNASGKLANLLAYSHRRRGVTAGRTRRPSQPRTEAQRATRRYMTFLGTQWSLLTIAELASWSDHHLDQTIPAYNRFLRHNVNQFKHLPGENWHIWIWTTFPSAAYPTTQATSAPLYNYPTITNGTGQFTINLNVTTDNDGWLWTAHRISATHPEAVYANLIGIWLHQGLGAWSHTLYDQDPGTFACRILPVSRTGKPDQHYKTKTVTVF